MLKMRLIFHWQLNYDISTNVRIFISYSAIYNFGTDYGTPL